MAVPSARNSGLLSTSKLMFVASLLRIRLTTTGCPHQVSVDFSATILWPLELLANRRARFSTNFQVRGFDSGNTRRFGGVLTEMNTISASSSKYRPASKTLNFALEPPSPLHANLWYHRWEFVQFEHRCGLIQGQQHGQGCGHCRQSLPWSVHPRKPAPNATDFHGDRPLGTVSKRFRDPVEMAFQSPETSRPTVTAFTGFSCRILSRRSSHAGCSSYLIRFCPARSPNRCVQWAPFTNSESMKFSDGRSIGGAGA